MNFILFLFILKVWKRKVLINKCLKSKRSYNGLIFVCIGLIKLYLTIAPINYNPSQQAERKYFQIRLFIDYFPSS